MDEADLAPVLDVAFGGGIGDAETGGVFQEGLCAESEREAPEELLLAVGALGGGFGEVGAGELSVDADGVADEDAGDGHGGAEVFIVADEGADFLASVAEAERGEDHRDAEGDEAQAPDAGDDVIPEEEVIFGLRGAVVGVEAVLLVRGELEFDLRLHLQPLVEVGEAPSDVVKDFFEGAALRPGEDVEPLQLEAEVVEDEAGEKAVFGVRDEGRYLPGRSGEDRREARAKQLYKLTVFTAGVGNGLVVEGLAETVAVVAEVGAEYVCQGVALGLEHQAVAAVVVEDLVNRGGGTVGRDEEQAQRRFLGRLQVGVLFLCLLVAGLLDAVVFHLGAVEVAHLLVDGLHETAAEREPALAGGCRCRDEQKEVGIDLAAGVDAIDARKAGREADDGAEDEQVGVFVGGGVAGHFVEDARQMAVEFLGEGGHRFGGGSFHHSISSINSIT